MDSSNNIIKWYPFEENAKVLEIYNEKSILEDSKLNINLTKIQYNESLPDDKFDYIFLAGVYEYAPVICKGVNPYVDFLNLLKNYLNLNGKLFLATDNRLGIKYLAGAKSSIYDKCFEGIQSEINNYKPSLLIKSELERIIKQSNFSNYKFYYPLGDYKNTNTIFTDNFLPKSDGSKLIYPTHYEPNSMVIYNEINVIKQICDNNDFPNFSNSYLIELTDNSCSTVKFVNYNIFRKKDYQLMLVIDDNGVRKTPETEEANGHIASLGKYINDLKELGINTIENFDEEKKTIESSFCNYNELDKVLINNIIEGKKDLAIKSIEEYFNYIKDKLSCDTINGQDIFQKYEIEVSSEIKSKLHFIEKGFIDLIFENIFVTEDGYLFYDQEWYYENIPIEFILYRAISNLYTYNEQKIKKEINKNELLDIFGLTEYIEIFEAIEKHIQLDIIDMERVEVYRKENSKLFYNIQETDSLIGDLKQKINDLENTIDYYKKNYSVLEEEHKKLVEVYTVIQNDYNYSRAWKVIKRIRKIIGRE